MASETSTYQLRNRYNPATQYFTDIEAESCLIISTTKIYHNTVFNHWEMVVEDDLGNTYNWKDFRCLEGADKANVKLALLSHLKDDCIKITTDGANDTDYKRTTTVVADRGAGEYTGE